MSLNNAEIDLVLRELELPGHSIQKIIQPDFRNLYFQLYRPPGAWWLRVCLEHPRVRLHATQFPPRAKRSHQRFEDFLHSRLQGGRITAAEHVHQDRIVRLEILHNGVTSHMYIRLWGTRSNIIVTDTGGTILDACLRKPQEGIETGGSFHPAPPETNVLREVRPHPPEAGFNTFLDTSCHQGEQQEERERLIATCTRALDRRIHRLEARLEEIERGRGNTADADQNQHYGELILAFLHTATPGSDWMEVEDYTRDNQLIRIRMDPTCSPSENAQAYFARAAKARESADFLQSTAENLQSGITAARATLEHLTNLSPTELRDLARDTGQRGKSDTGRSGEQVGLEFVSQGFRILVGRNARENDHLLRRSVRGNDWWMHTRDHPGGYVFIRAQKARSVPLDVLLDAGNLAVFFSKARSGGGADLYYTQVKYLRRAKGGPTGLVIPTQEKNLAVTLDPQRLRQLGIGSDLNLSGK